MYKRIFVICNSIINSGYPICKNCNYFLPCFDKTNINYNESKCIKYGTRNLVSGELIYDSSLSCREDKQKCGPTGMDYLSKQ
jgi:hypothetical protein